MLWCKRGAFQEGEGRGRQQASSSSRNSSSSSSWSMGSWCAMDALHPLGARSRVQAPLSIKAAKKGSGSPESHNESCKRMINHDALRSKKLLKSFDLTYSENPASIGHSVVAQPQFVIKCAAQPLKNQGACQWSPTKKNYCCQWLHAIFIYQ